MDGTVNLQGGYTTVLYRHGRLRQPQKCRVSSYVRHRDQTSRSGDMQRAMGASSSTQQRQHPKASTAAAAATKPQLWSHTSASISLAVIRNINACAVIVTSKLDTIELAEHLLSLISTTSKIRHRDVAEDVISKVVRDRKECRGETWQCMSYTASIAHLQICNRRPAVHQRPTHEFPSIHLHAEYDARNISCMGRRICD